MILDDSKPVLIVNQNGIDITHHTFEDTRQEDLERGKANLYSLGGQSVSTTDLNNSSIRI